eukprot:1058199-Pleurochrysis_carterae.AAC.3
MLTRASAHASPMPGILEVESIKASPTAEELVTTNSKMLGEVRKLMGFRLTYVQMALAGSSRC